MATYTVNKLTFAKEGNTYVIESMTGDIPTSEKGAANGVASLDSTGKVPSTQLPAFVDDVLEFDSVDFYRWPAWTADESYAVGDAVKITTGSGNDATVAGYICKTANSDATFDSTNWDEATKFPAAGEAGVIYVAKDTNIIYRWDDGEYVAISSAGGGNTKVYEKTITVTNITGPYNQEFEDDFVTADMKPVSFEVAREYVFGAPITVTPADGSFTVECDDVSGTTTVIISFIKATSDPTELSSDEFDILNNRITAVENTHVDTTVTIAASDWTSLSLVYTYEWESSMIVANSLVEVFVQDGAESAGIEGFNYVKSNGKVTFTADTEPTGNLPVIIRVINAKINNISEASGVSF